VNSFVKCEVRDRRNDREIERGSSPNDRFNGAMNGRERHLFLMPPNKDVKFASSGSAVQAEAEARKLDLSRIARGRRFLGICRRSFR
jgi:hypothetical protein